MRPEKWLNRREQLYIRAKTDVHSATAILAWLLAWLDPSDSVAVRTSWPIKRRVTIAASAHRRLLLLRPQRRVAWSS